MAQEVEEVFPGVVKKMPDSTLAISYSDFTALFVESIKEQQIQIETLQEIVYAQEKELNKLKKDYENCCKSKGEDSRKSGNTDSENTNNTAMLFDNTPNPFFENTEIKFYIPEQSKTASLIVHDMQGKEVKTYQLKKYGDGSLVIKGSELFGGMYLYSLLVDGKVIDTKRMILTGSN